MIRAAAIANIGAVGGYVTLFIPIGGSNHYLYYNSSMGPNQTAYFDTRQELKPGEELRVTTATSEFSILVTAYVFAS